MVKCLHRILLIDKLISKNEAIFGVKSMKKERAGRNFLLWAGLIFIILFSGGVFLFSTLGSFLSPQDKLEHTDVIVAVSGGDTKARTEKAIELYKEGYAPYLLFSGAARSGEVSNALSMKNYAIKSGIPSSAIFIEEKSNSTYENAKYSHKIIKENDWKSIILVTSPYHQRRAYMNFRFVLGSDFKIINQSAGDSWSAGSWYATKRSISITFEELSRVVYIFFTKDYSREAN